MQGKGHRNRIRAVVRLRPVIQEDNELARMLRMSPETCVHVRSDGQTIQLRRDAFESRDIRVDDALSSISTQREVYLAAGKDIVDDFVGGYNGFILAYGQTGSGKTHTMFGKGFETYSRTAPETLGVVHHAVQDIFSHMRARHQANFACRLFVSFYQIYNERVTDLLVHPKGVDTTKPLAQQLTQQLNVREDTNLGRFVIDGLSSFSVMSESELFSMINVAVSNRITKSQSCNDTSSRSHAILQLTLEQEESESPQSEENTEKNRNEQPEKGKKELPSRCLIKSVMTIVDLAGSERVRKSGSLTKGRKLKSGSYSKAEQLKEAQAINKSITALGICIQTMADASERGVKPLHVPFRDSKLTKLLAEALGGSTRTCIIATVGPCLCNYEETLSTLMFANRATSVKKSVKKVKAAPLNSLFSQHQMNWQWPKRPKLLLTSESSSDRVRREDAQEPGSDVFPLSEDDEESFGADTVSDDRMRSHEQRVPDRQNAESPDYSHRKSRLRSIALQLAAVEDELSVVSDTYESSPVVGRHSTYINDALNRTPKETNTQKLFKGHRSDEIIDEANVHPSSSKPPRFPQSPFKHAPEQTLSTRITADQFLKSNIPSYVSCVSLNESNQDKERTYPEHEDFEDVSPRSPAFSPPSSEEYYSREQAQFQRVYDLAPVDVSYEFNMPDESIVVPSSVALHRNDSLLNASRAAEGTLRYNVLSGPELSAITALQGAQVEATQSPRYSDYISDDDDSGSRKIVQEESGVYEIGNIFVAADVLEPTTLDYSYNDPNDSYEEDTNDHGSVDEYLDAAYEAEIQQDRQSARKVASSYISSSGGSYRDSAPRSQSRNSRFASGESNYDSDGSPSQGLQPKSHNDSPFSNSPMISRTQNIGDISPFHHTNHDHIRSDSDQKRTLFEQQSSGIADDAWSAKMEALSRWIQYQRSAGVSPGNRVEEEYLLEELQKGRVSEEINDFIIIKLNQEVVSKNKEIESLRNAMYSKQVVNSAGR